MVDFYEVKNAIFLMNLRQRLRNFQQHVVVSNDLNKLIDDIIRERNLSEKDVLVRIGIDEGGGFLKICLPVFQLKRYTSYGRRILNERFNDSGVKNLIILAIVPDIQENYANLKRLWLEAGIDKIARSYTITAYLKLCNIFLGMMSHSSTHPCCWCDVKNTGLGKKVQLRTIGSQLELFWRFFNAKAKRSDTKDYGNAIHPNMFATSDNIDESTLILCLVPPPELHLLI